MRPRPISTSDLRFFDPRSAIDHGSNRLPHWEQTDVACFVTFRLADSIPQDQLRVWAAERQGWLMRHPLPHTAEQQREHDDLFTSKLDAWLDQGIGSCAMRDRQTRQALTGPLARFDGTRYWHHAWVVMPNHVHLLFSPLAGHTLASILRSWKGVSARHANRHLTRTGDFWMKDYFDRLIREAAHFWRCARYIRRNPAKAHLPPSDYTHYESPFVRDFLDA